MAKRPMTQIPAILAAAGIAGLLGWLAFAPTVQEGAAPPPVKTISLTPDPDAIEAPPVPAGQSIVAATSKEPLFAQAMGFYKQQDYSRASYALWQASSKQPDNPEIRFYLGVCYLMTNDNRAGIQELQTATRLGDSPYSDQARFYLAKAFLKQKDSANAARELNALMEKGGTFAEPARRLKYDLSTVRAE